MKDTKQVERGSEVFNTGAGSTVKGFTYFLEWGQKPSTAVMIRSTHWRALREALNTLKVNEWLKIPVQVDETDYKLRAAFDRVRAALYSWSAAVKLESTGNVIITHTEADNEKCGAVWAIIVPLTDQSVHTLGREVIRGALQADYIEKTK